MFCPQCRAEYREGFAHCSECDVPLVGQVPAESGDAEDLIRVCSYSTDGEAFLARSVLESAGIDAMVSPPPQPGMMARSFGIGLPATDVYVRAEDFRTASEILSSAGQASES
jgi:hypothetical protein